MANDLLAALRGARRRPGFALAVLLTLAIGIGVATPVLVLVDALLLRPLPFSQPERVVGIWFASPNFPGGLPRVRQSTTTWLHIRDRGSAWSAVGLAEEAGATLEIDGEPVRVDGAVVTAEMFDVLGLGVIAGRPFTPADNAPGAPPVVLLTEDLWRTRFGADRAVVGRELTVDGVSRTIVGVMPRIAFPTAATRIWTPLAVDPARPNANFVYTGYGRLKPGTDLAAAEADFDRLVQLLPEASPGTFSRAVLDRLQLSASFSPLHRELVGDTRQTLLVALGAVLLVLLLVTANVATLFLVRGESRFGEHQVRLALGARPRRLARALLVESSAYAIGGAVIGLGLGAAGLTALKAIAPAAIPRLGQAAVDGRAVGLVLGLAALLGLAVGLLPALRLRRRDGSLVLRDGRRTMGGGHRTHGLRWALVSGQVALGLVLLVHGGLLVRSVASLNAIPLGFSAEGTLGLRLFLPARDYPAFEDVRRFVADLAARARELPAASAAGAVSFLPLRDGRIFHPWRAEDVQATEELPLPILTKLIGEGYLDAIRIPLRQGRRLERADFEQATGAVLVSEEVAARLWPGADPIGRRLRVGSVAPGDTTGWFHVVGVVGSVRDREVAAPAPPIIYAPFTAVLASTDRRWREVSLALRGPDAAALERPFRSLLTGLDPRIAVSDVRTMDQVIRDATGRTRYTMTLVVAAALAALLLAGVGIYGVLSHLIVDRNRELALRMALGASASSIRNLVLRQAALLTGTGVVLGGLLTIPGTRLLAGFLHEVSPADPLTLIVVAGTIVALGVVAAAVPARRAARVPPAGVLAEG